eukprot:2502721-Pyramimonas_sp.AAC.2
MCWQIGVEFHQEGLLFPLPISARDRLSSATSVSWLRASCHEENVVDAARTREARESTCREGIFGPPQESMECQAERVRPQCGNRNIRANIASSCRGRSGG